MRATAASIAPSRTNRFQKHRFDLLAVAVLMLLVAAIYGSRLSLQSLVGEETRWATGAREMLATGNWIVPRQQGRVFAERPPMTMWMMAAVGWLRGDVDTVAIRLPSVIAVGLMTLLIYVYARILLTQAAAFAAAIAYATMGQVLQIGRHGESEALFALFVSASLFIWHLGYLRGWRPLAVWSAGFALAALGSLVKGPQAPVYFVAITTAYLLMQSGWSYLVSWHFAAGMAVFAAIVAAWQIPFYLMTDWESVAGTWSGLAADRFHLSGALSHAATYPLETFACLLPWSPILIALTRRETRTLLADHKSVTTFLFTALAVAYPTVWLAAGARGRYFMPLYPLVAVLVGLVIDNCSRAEWASYPRRAWHQFLLLWGTVIGGSGLLIASASLFTVDFSSRFYQPLWFSIVYALFAVVLARLLWNVYRRADVYRPVFAVVAVAVVAGTVVAGFRVNINVARWIDPSDAVAQLSNQLPAGAGLVSFSPIEHRFAYYYRDAIAELGWPQHVGDLPTGVDYFCFTRHPGDTAESRKAGRGRTEYTTPGTLPFAWQEIMSICVERQVYDNNPRTVVLGRVVRPLQATTSDVTAPQTAIARQPIATLRR